MIDFKQYSVKDCIEQACYGGWHSPLIVGTTENKIDSYIGETAFTQYFNYNDQKFMAWSTHYSDRENCTNEEFQFTVKKLNRDFREHEYHLHYIHRRFEEILELKNTGYTYKIRKDKTKYLSKKRYEFKNKTMRMDLVRNEYTWYYKSHKHMTKINKNRTTEHFIHFKNTNVDIRENYNSKGVCTRSLLHLNDGRSVQIHLKKGKVVFFCQGNFGKLKYSQNIVLPNVHDASIVNLYTASNCFNIDLMLEDNELYDSYTSCLAILKMSVQDSLLASESTNPVLRTMMENIEEYEKKD